MDSVVLVMIIIDRSNSMNHCERKVFLPRRGKTKINDKCIRRNIRGKLVILSTWPSHKQQKLDLAHSLYSNSMAQAVNNQLDSFVVYYSAPSQTSNRLLLLTYW
ncbi:hypothetical protein LOAG_12696 [Loa loa]|uniref:Uncharacterized protein n=1 Tax=Loa loa TaxID=7209 RepID=A0A1S0TLA0_LOALO|nr:hypothetical protein LOAG_12696 [Loa loa]EFO15813.1 hypothetical protein LOAG_12696 [Loa loa]